MFQFLNFALISFNSHTTRMLTMSWLIIIYARYKNQFLNFLLARDNKLFVMYCNTHTHCHPQHFLQFFNPQHSFALKRSECWWEKKSRKRIPIHFIVVLFSHLINMYICSIEWQLTEEKRWKRN